MLDREGRPIIMNWIAAIFVTAFVVAIYAVLVPFNFVFKVGDETVYTQKSVAVYTDFEKNAETTEGYEVVYGESAMTFSFASGEKTVVFEKPYTELRFKMFLQAALNLVTLKWDRTDFTIEMNS